MRVSHPHAGANTSYQAADHAYEGSALVAGGLPYRSVPETGQKGHDDPESHQCRAGEKGDIQPVMHTRNRMVYK